MGAHGGRLGTHPPLQFGESAGELVAVRMMLLPRAGCIGWGMMRTNRPTIAARWGFDASRFSRGERKCRVLNSTPEYPEKVVNIANSSSPYQATYHSDAP